MPSPYYPWTGFSPLAAKTSPTRSVSPDTMPSDDDSSLVKDGSLEEMDVDVEDVDEVDAAFAALRRY